MRPTTATTSGEKWDGPQIAHARAKARRSNLARPQIPINMQASDVLTMRQRVRCQIDLGQLRSVDMRVDLRGRNIGMAQNLLQHTQVGTAREHVGGKGVAQGMGMEPHQPHLTPIPLAYRMHGLARQATSVLI